MFSRKQKANVINLERQIRLRDNSTDDGYENWSSPEMERDVLLQIVQRMCLDTKGKGIPGGIQSSQYHKMVDALIQRAIFEIGIELTEEQREEMLTLIKELLVGFGPLWPILEAKHPAVYICGCEQIVYDDGTGILKRWGDRFLEKSHVQAIILWLACLAGQDVSADDMVIQGTIGGIGKFFALLPPMAKHGPQLELYFTQRAIHGAEGLIAYGAEELIALGFMDSKIYEFLKLSAKLHLNILVIGEPGAGKTTLLRILGNSLSQENNLLVTVGEEDLLGQKSAVKKCIRPGNNEENRKMFRQIVRLCPEAVLVDDADVIGILEFLLISGELGGGCIGTVGCRELSLLHSVLQLQAQVSGSGGHLSETTVRHMLNNLDLVIQVNCHKDKVRRIARIAQLVNDEAGMIEYLQGKAENMVSFREAVFFKDIFVWGAEAGKFLSTGHVPNAIIKRAEASGIELDAAVFNGAGHYDGSSILTGPGGGYGWNN